MTPLILASGSISRAGLLNGAGVPFTVLPASVDEKAAKEELRHKSARDIARSLAELKALHVSKLRPDALVLGADQVLALGNEIVDKSANGEEAAVVLRRLRGKEHKLVTAVALAKGREVLWRYVDESILVMCQFTDTFLTDYLAREGDAILGCVGCYRLEGLGAQLFERIEGDYFSILGLPLLPVLSKLREHGVIAT